MTRDPALAADVHRPPRGRARLAISIAFWTVYSLVLFVKPLSWLPEQLRGATLDLRRWLIGLIDLVYGSLGIHQTGSYPMPWANELRWGLYFFLTAGVIPWAVLAIVRRGRPHDIGFRLPNRVGWRIVAVGFLVALPLQVWMVKSPTFTRYYLPQLERAGTLAFVFYYGVVILVEHFFFHGVLLATCRAGGRWPTPAPVRADADSAFGRTLQWVGLCQPLDGATGVRRFTRWGGLQDGCIPAILVSAMLFAAVHLGKDPRELVLSLPGGIALGYVSYRTNTWLVPFLLHALTAGTACALMLLME